MENESQRKRQIWETENITNTKTENNAESEILHEILDQIQSLKNLPIEEKQKSLQKMIDFIQESKPKKGVNVLLKSLDDSLDEFIGDPRKFVSCISQILKSIKEDPDKLQNVIMRFIQEKEIEHIQTDHFDFSLIDILLAQILHLYGEDVEFTKQMYDSIISTLFPTPETCYLQELISQFLLLCIGEKVSIVKKRMRALSVAPLSKVTMLSNKLVEITERYDAKIEAINQPTEPKESIESDL